MPPTNEDPTLEIQAQNALFWAAEQGDTAAVQQLLQAHNVDSRQNGWTPLHIASCKEHLEVAEQLINAGADVNARTSCQAKLTPLHLAASKGHARIVKLLLRAGADVPAVTGRDNLTPLHEAAVGGHAVVVKQLLLAGANPNALSRNHWTPLHGAAWAKSSDVVQLLLEAGAKVDSEGLVLELAAGSGNEEVINLVLGALDQVELSRNNLLLRAARAAAINGHYSAFVSLAFRADPEAVQDELFRALCNRHHGANGNSDELSDSDNSDVSGDSEESDTSDDSDDEDDEDDEDGCLRDLAGFQSLTVSSSSVSEQSQV